eukprot:456658-Amphidinium_carterae.1
MSRHHVALHLGGNIRSCHHHVIIMSSSCHHHVIMLSACQPHGHHLVIILSSCYQHVILLSSCHLVIIMSSCYHHVSIIFFSCQHHVQTPCHFAFSSPEILLINPVATSGCVIIMALSCHQRVMVLTSSCGHLVIMLSASSCHHVNSMPHVNIMSSCSQHVLFIDYVIMIAFSPQKSCNFEDCAIISCHHRSSQRTIEEGEGPNSLS